MQEDKHRYCHPLTMHSDSMCYVHCIKRKHGYKQLNLFQPFQFGRKSDTTGTAPLLTTKANVPYSLLTASFCKCKKGCTRNCLCKEKVLTEAACQCKGSAKACARVQVHQDTELENVVAYINQFQQ